MIVNRIDIPEPVLTGALQALGSGPFSARDLQTVLEADGVDPSVSAEAAKRLLQRERKAGAMSHDPTTGFWTVTPAAGAAPQHPQGQPRHPGGPLQTLPFNPGAAPAPFPLLALKLADASDQIRFIAAALACALVIFALALINASFAWETAETPIFRIALVSGMLALDLIRPLMMLQGVWCLSAGREAAGCLAIGISLTLAPVSVFSSTTMLAAAFELGQEEIAQDGVQTEAR